MSDYVPIADRLKVREKSPGQFAIEVMAIGRNHPRQPPFPHELDAGDKRSCDFKVHAITSAMRILAEDVRERCAEAVREKCTHCHGTGRGRLAIGSQCGYCGRPIAAIRGLDL